MKIKSKKGAVLLLISSLAFLLTVFLLADYQLKTDFLGKKQVRLLEAANQGESKLLYIDQMVKLSLAETWGSKHPGRIQPYIFSENLITVKEFEAARAEFKKVFDSKFKDSLKTFNDIYEQDLKYEEQGDKDFEITIEPYRAPKTKDKLGGLDVLGKANKKIVIQTSSEKNYIKYSVMPNFHIILSIEELNNLK